MVNPVTKAARAYLDTRNLGDRECESSATDYFDALIRKAQIVEFGGKRVIVFPQIEVSGTDLRSAIINYLSSRSG